jgi:hypothetical protein
MRPRMNKVLCFSSEDWHLDWAFASSISKHISQIARRGIGVRLVGLSLNTGPATTVTDRMAQT